MTDFVGQANIIGWNDIYTFDATAESTASSDGIDSAPGGQFDLFSFDDGSNTLIAEFVANLNSQYFNFIPTLSGLSISDNNWYTTPMAVNSPFDDIFIPTTNEPHVTITEANANFALSEIGITPLSTSKLSKENIRLAHNPIDNELIILNNSNVLQSDLTIIDFTGKIVYYSNNHELNNRTVIPINISSGMYLLNIKTNKGQMTFKVIIK